MWKDATVVSNQIVFFGSHKENATYLLKKESTSNGLRMEGKEGGIDYKRGAANSSFCTFREKIYFFALEKEDEVFCFNVSTGKANRVYPH